MTSQLNAEIVQLYTWVTDPSKDAGAKDIVLASDADQLWIAAPGLSSDTVSFRQAAVVKVSLLPLGQGPDFSLPREVADLVGQTTTSNSGQLVLGQEEVLCLEIAAAAFNVSGEGKSCAPLDARLSPSWAWSLYPRAEAAGSQVVTVTFTVEPRVGEVGPEGSAAPAIFREVSLLKVNVERSSLDRYTNIVSGIIAATAALIAVVIKAVIDKVLGADAD